MSSYEIEIKSLLGSKENADRLVEKLHVRDAGTKLVGENRQLNHYFEGGDVHKLGKNIRRLFNKKEQEKLRHITDKGSDFSVRTRLTDGERLRLVVKASVGEDTSANGVSRIEFDAEVEGMALGELDQLILDSGFTYQAKWSRERHEYACGGVNVCIDKNAGYGYLAEFERVVDNADVSQKIEKELRSFMGDLGCEELPQDRLERMFSYYNTHWPEYYGTDKVFVVT